MLQLFLQEVDAGRRLLADLRQDAAGPEMAAWRGSRCFRFFKPPLHGAKVGADFFELAARWSCPGACLLKPSSDSRVAMEMTGTRYRGRWRGRSAKCLRRWSPDRMCHFSPTRQIKCRGRLCRHFDGVTGWPSRVYPNKTGKHRQNGSPTLPVESVSARLRAFRAFLVLGSRLPEGIGRLVNPALTPWSVV